MGLSTGQSDEGIFFNCGFLFPDDLADKEKKKYKQTKNLTSTNVKPSIH